MSVTVTVGSNSGGNGVSTLTSTLVINSNVFGNPAWSLPIIQNIASPMQSTLVNFDAGDNTITVNAIAGGMVVVPPNTGTVAMTMKGIGSDTGLPMAPNAPFLMCFNNSTRPASVVLNAAAGITGVQIIFF